MNPSADDTQPISSPQTLPVDGKTLPSLGDVYASDFDLERWVAWDDNEPLSRRSEEV